MQRRPTNKRVALEIPEINDGEALWRVVMKSCIVLVSPLVMSGISSLHFVCLGVYGHVVDVLRGV